MPSFVAISSAVPEKIFEGFFTVYGHGGYLGQVTWFINKYIGSSVTQMLPINLTLTGQAIFAKKNFEYYINII